MIGNFTEENLKIYCFSKSLRVLYIFSSTESHVKDRCISFSSAESHVSDTSTPKQDFATTKETLNNPYEAYVKNCVNNSEPMHTSQSMSQKV